VPVPGRQSRCLQRQLWWVLLGKRRFASVLVLPTSTVRRLGQAVSIGLTQGRSPRPTKLARQTVGPTCGIRHLRPMVRGSSFLTMVADSSRPFAFVVRAAHANVGVAFFIKLW